LTYRRSVVMLTTGERFDIQVFCCYRLLQVRGLTSRCSVVMLTTGERFDI